MENNRKVTFLVLCPYWPLALKLADSDPCHKCKLTARQYGEVVFPDAAPSRSRYFSQKAVTVQGGYGVVFAVRIQILLSITRVAVQVLSEPENCHRTGFLF